MGDTVTGLSQVGVPLGQRYASGCQGRQRGPRRWVGGKGEESLHGRWFP